MRAKHFYPDVVGLLSMQDLFNIKVALSYAMRDLRSPKTAAPVRGEPVWKAFSNTVSINSWEIAKFMKDTVTHFNGLTESCMTVASLSFLVFDYNMKEEATTYLMPFLDKGFYFIF